MIIRVSVKEVLFEVTLGRQPERKSSSEESEKGEKELQFKIVCNGNHASNAKNLN